MLTSLATIAPDCIAQLIEYLDSNDFVLLMKTGNRLLRHKLRNNCFGLDFEALNTAKFPFSALKLPKLRCLTVIATKGIMAYMDFRNRDEMRLVQGNKSIEKIKLRFSNSPSLFLAPEGNSLRRLSIRDRFPSLTTLILHEFISEDSLQSLFGELPETLTTFSLKTRCGRYLHPLCLSSVANLPRNLKKLVISGYIITAPPEEDFFNYEKVLPPGLTHLSLACLQNIEILNNLPFSLQILQFTPSSEMKELHWRISKLPPGLVIFSSGWSRPIAPPTSTFALFKDFESTYGFTIESLPENLKILPSRFFEDDEDEVVTSHRFPYLEKATIHCQTTVAHLPESLKTLECCYEPAPPLRFYSRLPSGLTELIIRSMPHPGDLHHIPSTLTSLIVTGDWDEDIRCSDSDFPPWIASDFAQFASKIHLVNLGICGYAFESVSNLTPLAKMETLKIFRIDELYPEQAIDSSNWFPKCLPKSLTSIELSVGNWATLDRDETNLSKSWTLCDLKNVTPNLKSLKLHCYYVINLFLDGKCCSSLPQGLIKLDLHSKSGKVELGAFSQLPRSLQCFTLYFGTAESLSDAHFEDMPPSLAQFDLHISWKSLLTTTRLLEILPKSISKFKYHIEHERQSFEEFELRAAEFLRSNAILDGFRYSDLLRAKHDT